MTPREEGQHCRRSAASYYGLAKNPVTNAWIEEGRPDRGISANVIMLAAWIESERRQSREENKDD